MEPHPERERSTQSEQKGNGRGWPFHTATLACIRKHSHKCSLVGNEAASMCVREDFKQGGVGGALC